MNFNGRMSFGNFIFPVNPYLIKISHKRRASKRGVPYGDDYVSDTGNGSRIISGEGEFFGENALQDFERLKRILERENKGILYVPSQKPVFAYFSELEMMGRDIEGVIKYSFIFIESKENSASESEACVITDGKHSLWDYSCMSGGDIEILRKLNPDIKRPDIPLEAGRKISLC